MATGELSDFIERKVKDVVRANNEELLGNIGQMLNKISSKPQSSNLGIRQFKRKSNEEQFKVNAKVLDSVETANSALAAQDLSSAKEAITQAMDMLKHRQKLVLLADSSELGWRVVSEYETNPIASDSDDEKRILRAEARASRKAKAEKTKSRRFQPYRRAVPTAPLVSSVTSAQVPKQRPGLCFTCGKPGHWKNECSSPRNVNQANNKLSSFKHVLPSDKAPCMEMGANVQINKGILENAECSFKHTSGQATQVRSEKEVTSSCTVNSPVGRLKSYKEKWLSVSDSQYITDVVENGYKLPFKILPEPVELKNNKSARDNPSFVSAEIASLVKKGVLEEVGDKPHVVNPLTVAYNRVGKARLVLDCRHINSCLHLFHVKFEDIKVAEKMFCPGSYVFTFDLSGAYHHIDIFSSHSTYLGLQWDGKYFVFRSLPFGIATAGHIFTKVLRVIVKYWRSLGHKIIMFLDDGIGGHTDFQKSLECSNFVHISLEEFGFLIAEKKCEWFPSRLGHWLGHTLDYRSNRLFISSERICRLEVALRSVIFQLSNDGIYLISVRFLASVVGQIVSLQSVLGKIVCRMTKYLHTCIDSRASWNAPVRVTESAFNELLFWLNNVKPMNGSGKSLTTVSVANYSMYTDASAVGYGGYVNRYKVSNVSDVSTSGNVCEFPEASSSCTWMQGTPGSGSVNCKHSRSVLDCMKLQGIPRSESVYEFPEVSSGCIDMQGTTGSGSVNIELPEVSSCCQSVPGTPGSGSVYEFPEVSSGCIDMQGTPGSGSVDYELPEVSSNCDLMQLNQWSGTVDSEASEVGSGFPCAVSGVDSTGVLIKGSEVTGCWTDDEMVRSSTWRELEAINRVLKSNLIILRSSVVLVFTDNKYVTYILDSGSRVEELHTLCLDIHRVCDLNKISLLCQWVPRSVNCHADYLSRCLDCDDWSISDIVFLLLNNKWGPFSIDRVSSHYNNKCIRFNSKWWVPGTEHVDCFTQTWTGENNWLVPPPDRIVECINKILLEKCSCTMVVPRWQSAPYWPLLVNKKGVGLKETLKRKFDDSGVRIEDSDRIIDRMAMHVLASRSDNTVTKYHNQMKGFVDFCAEKGFSYRPAQAIHVAMYLSSLIDSQKSASVISAVFYSIKWYHNINDFVDPTTNALVKSMLECGKRLNSKPVVKKDVVSTEHLIELCDMFSTSTDVIALRDLAMILLAYAGFLRFDELSIIICNKGLPSLLV